MTELTLGLQLVGIISMSCVVFTPILLWILTSTRPTLGMNVNV